MTQRDLTHHCVTLAHQFRLGQSAAAVMELPALLEQAMGQLPSQQQSEFGAIVAALLTCQERQDWIGLADWLEGEMVALLERLD